MMPSTLAPPTPLTENNATGTYTLLLCPTVTASNRWHLDPTLANRFHPSPR